ncbi:MAG: hypothetical protein SFU87_01265 [Chitinophagaceae bacterium]|nr:hypothetical protein [Chitinophagaceae bacterium]
MEKLFRTLSDYYSRPDFRKFQNTVGREVYEVFGTSYSNADGEVRMVTDLCKSIDGKSFDRLKLYSKKIHGSRSFVEFHNQDKPTTKELADMVVIAVATSQRKIIFEKTAFIQNKKESTEANWKIDQDQLYLLHNFPTFKGAKGIFKKSFGSEVIFLNQSQTLGNYGFFQSPGEMTLASALTVYKLQSGDTISLDEIRKFKESVATHSSGFQFPFLDHPMWEDMFYRYFKYFPKHGLPFMNLPFLSNSEISLNVYEFIRNWTYFNIGEVCSAFDYIVDKDLSTFTRLLLRTVGLSNFIDLNVEGGDLDSNLTILVAHLNLDEKQ